MIPVFSGPQQLGFCVRFIVNHGRNRHISLVFEVKQSVARQSRLRLPGELIRDSSLFVSGLLNPQVGGKSVRPPCPLV
jgi:hypothetical protein